MSMQIGNITLYFCSLECGLLTEDSSQLFRSWLSENEKTKVDRYIQASGREQGLLVRGYLRGLLSLYLVHKTSCESIILPQQWQFEYGEKGKPRLSDQLKAQTGISFNISHSGEHLVVAITHDSAEPETMLGVDIERHRDKTNCLAILKNYFTEYEREALLALPEKEQRGRFFDLWALKESYIKAVGLGLALPLKSFGFDLSKQIKSPIQSYGMDLAPLNQFELSTGIRLFLLPLDDAKQLNTKLAMVSYDHSYEPNWTIYFGRLNEEYRFALSFKAVKSKSPVIIELDLSQFLASVYDILL